MKKKDIGKKIKAAIREKGHSPRQIELATKLQGYQLRGIEDGKSKYTIDSLLALCDHLGLKLIIQ